MADNRTRGRKLTKSLVWGHELFFSPTSRSFWINSTQGTWRCEYLLLGYFKESSNAYINHGFSRVKDIIVLCRNVSHTLASLNNYLLISWWIIMRVITMGNNHSGKQCVCITGRVTTYFTWTSNGQLHPWDLGYAFLRSVSLALRDELDVTVTQELSRWFSTDSYCKLTTSSFWYPIVSLPST